MTSSRWSWKRHRWMGQRDSGTNSRRRNSLYQNKCNCMRYCTMQMINCTFYLKF